MVSLWGTKKSSDENENNDGAEEQPEQGQTSRRSEDQATERTRLLPREEREQREHLLDPDDPAVSPYNLWSVRALRVLAIFFLAVSFVWWTILFVSIFVSPPGMSSRGSGFFDVSFTTLTVGNLVIATLFFATPSKAAEVSNIILAFILLIDMILIAAAERVRTEEGWVGLTSVIWAFFISLFLVITDRFVTWGKSEEEERLTGRRETRHSLREWLSILTASIFDIVFIIIALLLMATIALRVRDSTLDAPGELYTVDDGKYRVHLSCVGDPIQTNNGTQLPTILFEAGEMPFKYEMESWVHKAFQEGNITRYCYWDRPGMAFSENAPSPHSAGMSVDALSNALAQAGEEGPWVLVSAGIGSIYSRIFSSRHVNAVKGIVMIDPLHENRLYEVGDPARGLRLWARGFVSPLGLDRLSGAIFRGRNREDRVYGRVSYQGGKFLKAKLQESLVAASFTRSEISQARNIQQKDVNLVVISSGIETQRDEQWLKEQIEMTHITDKLIHWDRIRKAPHEVWRADGAADAIVRRIEELVRW